MIHALNHPGRTLIAWALQTLRAIVIATWLAANKIIFNADDVIMFNDDNQIVIDEACDCECERDPCDCHDLQCSHCETGCTPNCWRVPFSGINLCVDCDDFGGGTSNSAKYSFINGFDPNDTFDLVQISACQWRLTVADAFRENLYPDEVCGGTPTATDYDVIIDLTKTSDTEATLEMYVDLGAGNRYVIFTDTITVASKYCGSMSFANENVTCFVNSGGGFFIQAVATGGTADAQPCCPEEEVPE